MTDDLWSYSPTCGHRDGTDLAGWSVEAADGPVGDVDDHSDEAGSAHLVVDAGSWIFGKLLVPASAVARCDTEKEVLHLNLTKEQVKDAPRFLPDRGLADAEYRDDVAAYFRTAARSRRHSAR